jgi:hypothetical protein
LAGSVSVKAVARAIHEHEAAEHRALLHVGSARERREDTVGELLVVSHRASSQRSVRWP